MKNFNWSGGLFLIGYHVALLISLPIYLYYWPLNWGLMAAAFVLYVLAALGITAGYHRFYSHRTFEPHPMLESFLLFLGTLATQGSAIEWTHDHRLHHQHVDTERDPYRTSEGFWASHLLWMFKKREHLDEKRVSDLLERPLVRFQHEHYGLLLVFSNVVPVVLFGWYFNDYVGAIVLALLARLFLVHHCTWFINSLAHMWGSKPYSTEHSAVNNWILAVLTMGEGYHNYHHTFAGDYRNGVRFYQYDITKLFIWLAGKLGLATGLKRVKDSAIRKKLVLEDRKLMLQKIRQHEQPSAWSQFEKEIVEISDRLVTLLTDWEQLKQSLTSHRQSDADRTVIKQLRDELTALNRRVRKETRSWSRLCREISKTPLFS